MMQFRSLRNIRVLVGALALAASSACASTPREAAPAVTRNAAERPYVVLVSFDGFRHDYADRWHAPTLRRVAREGGRAEALIPSFPSKTFPNHYTLVTGMYPGNHGLLGNEVFDPRWDAWYGMRDSLAVRDARWYGGEPLWVTAERQGVTSASFFWPGSEAAIGETRPTYWKRFDDDFPNAARVDTVLSWLSKPAESRPHFITLYFSDVDHAGHDHGPDAPETARAVAHVDSLLARLIDGARALPVGDRVNVVVVSDHGMTAVRPAQNTLYLDEVVPLEGVDVVAAGNYAQLFFRGDTARMEAVRAALAARLPHSRVYRRAEIPARFHFAESPRAGDLLVVMEAPWEVRLRRRARDAETPAGAVRGSHGYDPANPDMHGILYAWGPAFRPGGRVGRVENVHVYPLVTRILGLRPNPEIDGREEALRPLLR